MSLPIISAPLIARVYTANVLSERLNIPLNLALQLQNNPDALFSYIFVRALKDSHNFHNIGPVTQALNQASVRGGFQNLSNNWISFWEKMDPRRGGVGVTTTMPYQTPVSSPWEPNGDIRTNAGNDVERFALFIHESEPEVHSGVEATNQFDINLIKYVLKTYYGMRDRNILEIVTDDDKVLDWAALIDNLRLIREMAATAKADNKEVEVILYFGAHGTTSGREESLASELENKEGGKVFSFSNITPELNENELKSLIDRYLYQPIPGSTIYNVDRVRVLLESCHSGAAIN